MQLGRPEKSLGTRPTLGATGLGWVGVRGGLDERGGPGQKDLKSLLSGVAQVWGDPLS